MTSNNQAWIAPWEDLEAVVIRYMHTYGDPLKVIGTEVRRDLKRIIQKLEEQNSCNCYIEIKSFYRGGREVKGHIRWLDGTYNHVCNTSSNRTKNF